jgi:hypothetical protein
VLTSCFFIQVITVFVIVGVIFVPIGVVSLRASHQVCPVSYKALFEDEFGHFVYVAFFLCCRLLRSLIGMMMHVYLLM